MPQLRRALDAWKTPEFNRILKEEIKAIDPAELPLQAGLSTGSYALDKILDAMIIGVSEEGDHIRVRAGIFYSGIIPGCSCADDPTPIDEHSEYCEVELSLDKTTAETTISLAE